MIYSFSIQNMLLQRFFVIKIVFAIIIDSIKWHLGQNTIIVL